MLKKIIAVPIFLLMFFGSTAYASGVALGIKIGTLGGGIEMEKPLTDTLTGRIGLNYLSYSYEGTEDDIDYDFDLNLKTLGAMLDWHPFENG
ncbi:MAG: hypothetical protein GY707_15550, partial [Desulfobacteraceae bacterium]|nr:hypothetical protein [Desulfobacteraceae bacterium]